jgi:hypothetical protein
MIDGKNEISVRYIDGIAVVPIYIYIYIYTYIYIMSFANLSTNPDSKERMIYLFNDSRRKLPFARKSL